MQSNTSFEWVTILIPVLKLSIHYKQEPKQTYTWCGETCNAIIRAYQLDTAKPLLNTI